MQTYKFIKNKFKWLKIDFDKQKNRRELLNFYKYYMLKIKCIRKLERKLYNI